MLPHTVYCRDKEGPQHTHQETCAALDIRGPRVGSSSGKGLEVTRERDKREPQRPRAVGDQPLRAAERQARKADRVHEALAHRPAAAVAGCTGGGAATRTGADGAGGSAGRGEAAGREVAAAFARAQLCV